MARRLTRSVLLAGGLALVAAGALPATAAAAHPAPDRASGAWRLVDSENFAKPLPVDRARWTRDPLGTASPWHVDHFDDDGPWYHVRGGADFERDVRSFDLMRKRVAFGKGGWLTAELGDMDFRTKQPGASARRPAISRVRQPGGGYAAKISEPGYRSGALIRSTRPLPSRYRIEYALRTLDFGGERNGTEDYDGKTNGYKGDRCTTNYPWKASGSYAGAASPCNTNFSDVRTANGFYYLEITDFPAAPHNNVLVHSHRKVGMDAYNTSGSAGDGAKVCDPASKKLYAYNDGTHNAVNAVFNDGAKFQNPDWSFPSYLTSTPCGDFNDQEPGLVESAELRPELMPHQAYRFAIERDATGYTMEMSGNFAHVGRTTIREHRGFTQGGHPVWHYNNTPGQYDGSHDSSLTMSGPYGSYTVPHTWPKGSAYPDYFVIGDPHLNYYEGSATVGDINLYVPRG
ncbi:MAG TPA: hypothetical protein VGL93_28440 [Streptosporangiaceae bacterium]|jgi:hypothetical protein